MNHEWIPIKKNAKKSKNISVNSRSLVVKEEINEPVYSR